MKVGWLDSKKFWLVMLGGILFALVGSQLPLKDWFMVLRNWLGALGTWAMPTFILLYLLATIVGLPNVILILVAGALFGLVKGIILVSFSDTLGGIACFAIGRTIARKHIKRWINKYPNFAQLDLAVGKKGWKVLLLTRLSPLVPSNILNYGFSCTKVNFWQYCLFSWLGMLPTIFLYVYAGAFGTFMFDGKLTPRKLALQTVGLLVTIAAAFYTTRLARKALTPDCPAEEPKQNANT
jgi:uncharacterized membrane protein YdjX (TVP38/TMEM64 family)